MFCTETEVKQSVVDIEYCVLKQGRNREGMVYNVVY